MFTKEDMILKKRKNYIYIMAQVGQDTYREIAAREDKLQKEVVRLTEDNLELRFELEQAKKDLPRLKVSTV